MHLDRLRPCLVTDFSNYISRNDSKSCVGFKKQPGNPDVLFYPNKLFHDKFSAPLTTFPDIEFVILIGRSSFCRSRAHTLILYY